MLTTRRGQASIAILASLASGGLGALLATQAPAKDMVQLVAAVVIVLALAGVGLLQLVHKLRGGGEKTNGEVVAQAQWRGEVTATLGQLVSSTAKETEYLSRLRHDILVPCHNILTDLAQRTEGIEHAIHDDGAIKEQLDEIHRSFFDRRKKPR